MNTNTVILTIHNKEKSIKNILTALVKSLSPLTTKLIIVFDGCKDNTTQIVKETLETRGKRAPIIRFLFTDDEWETKANNAALKLVDTNYASIVQDDMLIKQKNWDELLIRKLSVNNIFSISGRGAYNFNFKNNKFNVVDLVGREYPFSSGNIIGKIIGKLFAIFKPYWIYKYIKIFNIRNCSNRGPLVIDMNILKELNFFDECFAPFELDDTDLCCRAIKKYGLYSGSLPIYYKEINGSKKINKNSSLVSKRSITKNTKILIERHSDLVV